MTEAEWLACADPEKLLNYLRRKKVATDRKLLLYGCACCRLIWDLIPPGCGRDAVEVAERRADGITGERDQEVQDELYTLWKAAIADPAKPANRAIQAAFYIVHPEVATAARRAMEESWNAAYAPGEGEKRANLLREVIPRPLVRQSSRLTVLPTPTVRGLATACYEERELPSGHLDPARLAVLADALEETGYADSAILGHLRGPGPHVRGCWALDLVLSKE
jgi:hypothetical protein